jgi:tetraacyldisaccharide 4'-kinase
MAEYEILLSPAAKVYEAGVRLRNWLYSEGLFRVHQLKQPVISVGNLTMGGTGKTPTIIVLGQLLQRAGYLVSILLRGYKGLNQGRPLLVSNGRTILTNSRMAGDEALVIAKNLPAALVAVAKNRAQAGAWIESRFPVDVHLLDDGFQHRKVHRNLDLVLVDVTNPFDSGRLPPLGKLREPLEGLSRSDAVILSRTQIGQTYPFIVDTVRSHNPRIPYFLARQKFASATIFHQGQAVTVRNLHNTRALAFAGIANTRQFFDSLEEWGVELVDTLSFPDHHRYRSGDLDRIKEKCLELGIETVVTTEKDLENFEACRLHPLKVVVVKVGFEFDDPEGLRRILLDKVGVLTP